MMPVRTAIADYATGPCWMAVGQRVRERKKRLIGSVAVRRLMSIHLLLVTLIVCLTLMLLLPPFQTVTTMNDDGNGHDDNE